MTVMFNHPHPGTLVKATLLDATGLSVTNAAKHLGVTRVALSKLINCHSNLSTEMAIRLSLALNTSEGMWLNLQRNYDLWTAKQLRKRIAREVSRIGTKTKTVHCKRKTHPTSKSKK